VFWQQISSRFNKLFTSEFQKCGKMVALWESTRMGNTRTFYKGRVGVSAWGVWQLKAILRKQKIPALFAVL